MLSALVIRDLAATIKRRQQPGLARHIGKVEARYQPGRACWLVPSEQPDELQLLRRRIECLLGGSVTIGTASGKFAAQVAGASGGQTSMTRFCSAPMPSMLIVTTSSTCKVNAAGGTMPAPVNKNTPLG